MIIRSIAELATKNNLAGTEYNLTTSIIGPIGVRVQYMLTDNFAIGADISFEQKKAKWTGSIWDDRNSIYVESPGVYQVTKVKAMVRSSWEFINKGNFTMNWANSIGYKMGSRITKDPNNEFGLNFSRRVFRFCH